MGWKVGRNLENRRLWQQAYNFANRVKIRDQRRRRYAEKKRNLTEEQKAAHQARENARYHDQTKHWKQYHAIRTKRYRVKLKTQIIQGYGGACTCCGETAPEFLTLDHVNNDGKAHRIALYGKNASATVAVYRHVRDAGFPPDYTVLCFNCNIARSLFGVCPHQVEAAKK